MKLYELVDKYHRDTNLTCAEAMFKACNEYYNLNLNEENRALFSLMGIGMQTEMSSCGAFTVAVGIIGLFTTKENQINEENEDGIKMVTKLSQYVLDTFDSLQCCYLNQLEIDGYENPCHCIVVSIAKKLEELIDNYLHNNSSISA